MVDAQGLPEDVEQDDVDDAVARLRARLTAEAAAAGHPDAEIRVWQESREGRLWIVGEVVTTPTTPPPGR